MLWDCMELSSTPPAASAWRQSCHFQTHGAVSSAFPKEPSGQQCLVGREMPFFPLHFGGRVPSCSCCSSCPSPCPGMRAVLHRLYVCDQHVHIQVKTPCWALPSSVTLPWIASTWRNPVLKAVFGRLEFFSSDERCRIPTFLLLNECVTLGLFFSMVPDLCCVVP